LSDMFRVLAEGFTGSIPAPSRVNPAIFPINGPDFGV
jgi:hypothetical protein